jgi:hypothetical protein
MLKKIITDYTSIVEALYHEKPQGQRRQEHDRNIEQLKILDVALNKCWGWNLNPVLKKLDTKENCDV